MFGDYLCLGIGGSVVLRSAVFKVSGYFGWVQNEAGDSTIGIWFSTFSNHLQHDLQHGRHVYKTAQNYGCVELFHHKIVGVDIHKQ